MGELEDSIQKMDFRAIVFTAIITALSFVVGLFWRDAITETINQFVPGGEGIFYKYLAAVIATIIVVIFAYILIRVQNLKMKRLMDTIGEIDRKSSASRRKAVKKILSQKI